MEQPEPSQTWWFDQADEVGRVPVKRRDQDASRPSGSLESLDADGRRFQKVKLRQRRSKEKKIGGSRGAELTEVERIKCWNQSDCSSHVLQK